MQTWQDILALAIVGTSRQNANLAPAGDDLGGLLAQLEGADRERGLLAAAALAALYRRAGQQPLADSQPFPDACEPDQAACCTTAAGQHLALMLSGEFAEVLPEWLQALSRLGGRVPEELLPALLDKGQEKSALRRLIVPVLGKRGRWLAAQNPEWRYAAASLEGEVWETGSRDERLWLLETLRATDPARARERLASSWKSEQARDRAAFLNTFVVGLSGEDESFLDEAHRDRSAEVRRVARDLLARLPDSRLSQQVLQWIGEWLAFRKPLLGRARIEVSFPADWEERLKTTGIDLETPAQDLARQPLGPKARCLQELAGMVPAPRWCDRWSRTPVEIIKAAVESEWKDPLLAGFIASLRRHPDAAWIEAVLTHQGQLGPPTAAIESDDNLASYLPTARLEALILGALESDKSGLHNDHPGYRLLLAHRRPWSDALSRAVVESVKQRIELGAAGVPSVWHAQFAVREFARYVPPALHDEFLAGWPDEADGWYGWDRSIEHFQSLLSFRRDMLDAMRIKD